MATSRIMRAKPHIVNFVRTTSRGVMRRSDLTAMLAEKRDDWRLPQSMTGAKFIDFLLTQTELREIELHFPSRAEVRYSWGEPSVYDLLMSLRPKAYSSHYTALVFHGLTEQDPKTLYVNAEQSPKPRASAPMTQATIDRAFSRPPRRSKNVAVYGQQRICLLSGKHTGDLGVIETTGPGGETVRVTNLERTLIDVTVRPFYAGGVFEVLKGFRTALDRISVNKLSATLRKLDYVYPYHQAIGFYLERAGLAKTSAIKLLRRFEMRYDFYLDHQIGDRAYSDRWRIFFPKGL